MYRRWGKRLLDFVAALVALAVLWPLLLLLAAFVRASMGSPIVFRQQRPGLRGTLFTLYKFRTMTEARDSSGQVLDDGHRLTRVGRFLRKFSLDELPELWNVLKGHMSLVGPRPLLVEYLPLYSSTEARRHDVRPGLTGWAQVNGRNALPWKDKLRLDVWYVDHVSLLLDLRVLWRTCGLVARAKGISADVHPTMRKFTGSQS